MGYLAILAAMPLFFLSTVALMILWIIIPPNSRIEKMDCLRPAVAASATAVVKRINK